jgi:hypothetical protein
MSCMIALVSSWANLRLHSCSLCRCMIRNIVRITCRQEILHVLCIFSKLEAFVLVAFLLVFFLKSDTHRQNYVSYHISGGNSTSSSASTHGLFAAKKRRNEQLSKQRFNMSLSLVQNYYHYQLLSRSNWQIRFLQRRNRNQSQNYKKTPTKKKDK